MVAMRIRRRLTTTQPDTVSQTAWQSESGDKMAVQMLQTRESRTDALVRLAAKARHEGVHLFRDRSDGRYYASSASTPGLRYMVTGYSCECRGFVAHGHCKHYAALMAALGWIEGSPEQTPEPLAITASGPCRTCDGHGTHPATVAYGRIVRFEDVTCERCHGSGQAEAA